ncbi:hypothetical protein HW132_31060 [Brasilonema sp. CT11]|nr:hypothetical protein [Brasilonema sp. CT11]
MNRSEPSNGQRGCLYPYIQNKRLKDGTIKSYPKVIGERNPDIDSHWRWAYCWHDPNNGYKKRSISIPYSFLNAVRSLISSGIGEKNMVESDRIPQRILQLIRCAK